MHEKWKFWQKSPGMIFSPQTFSCEIEGKIFIFMHGNFIFMHGDFIFACIQMKYSCHDFLLHETFRNNLGFILPRIANNTLMGFRKMRYTDRLFDLNECLSAQRSMLKWPHKVMGKDCKDFSVTRNDLSVSYREWIGWCSQFLIYKWPVVVCLLTMCFYMKNTFAVYYGYVSFWAEYAADVLRTGNANLSWAEMP